MRKVCCEECGKKYDYDVDDFCPRCGAYNPPKRQESALRRDGLGEDNHAGSFLHSELHAEDKARRRAGLERPAKKKAAPVRMAEPLAGAGQEKKARKPRSEQEGKQILAVVVVILVFLLQMCST